MKYIEASLYKEILSNIPIVCVDIILNHNGRVLLVKRKDMPEKGKWWFVGGRLHKGETLKCAVLRKVFEETGIECQVGHLLTVREYMSEDGSNVHSINLVYTAYIHSDFDNVKLDHTSSDYKVISKIPKDVDDYLIDCLKLFGL